ncbi:PE family protein, partial [Mycobacterium simulans]|uniref:PE family protein n=1 Tax=Mycobacterium simulans TaxID=627089 RepID=UPI00174C207A
MSFVSVAPDMLVRAASDLAGLGSAINTANATAASSTTTVLAAAADEVSEGIAALFGMHAQEYQALGAQATAFHEQFARALTTAGRAFASAEAANAAATASPLETLEEQILGVINAPTQILLGRPLIGDGANGAPGTGQAGGAGGLLWGN